MTMIRLYIFHSLYTSAQEKPIPPCYDTSCCPRAMAGGSRNTCSSA